MNIPLGVGMGDERLTPSWSVTWPSERCLIRRIASHGCRSDAGPSLQPYISSLGLRAVAVPVQYLYKR